ncbi:sushi, nidogen and EGF-like domain-containing protein 1 isoform X1 [Ruditapes philippinarum]|uniref:sushi, nidogen and EGF-like domain-containing protein 1 isoform X1 n=1 Tax=Ruditapes philippinarum TaxID=129788 RepID=UPI00295A58C8|nr:sushi, nidogen and EGF-like domain-containing protein 1 isoform X1 [Ruditapes philippinarum]
MFGLIEGYSCNRDCGDHGKCYNYFGEHCRCNGGYTGDRCQYVDHCYNKCQHRGRCQRTDTSPYFKCTCNYGYLGERCEQDHCVSSPCKNGGTCHRDYKGIFYRCSCLNGYIGVNCDVSACTSTPCQNGGKCSVSYNSPYYQCSCSNGFTGNQCENNPPTTALPVTSVSVTMDVKTTQTTTQTTSSTELLTTSPNITLSCSKFSSVFDLAEKAMETNVLAVACPSGNHTSPEAYVLNNCGVQYSTYAWKQGYNVRTLCKQIPPYTPVATFEQGAYVPSSSTSGIFIGCLVGSTGFTIAIQRCDQVPQIDHIDFINGTTAGQHGDFYTIEL